MKVLFLLTGTALISGCASIKQHESFVHVDVSDRIIAQQRDSLAKSTLNKGFGPQSPRNIDSITGNNTIVFNAAPDYTKMNLCNIHFHKNAEHSGGEFTKYAGNGDGKGYKTGYVYSGKLSSLELTPVDQEVCPSKHGSLNSGDTIEVHYVYSSAQVKPGKSLGNCLSPPIMNPQLRVETQVYVLVKDEGARNFSELTDYGIKNDFQQALNIPETTGTPIQYAGSTTGPDYNEKGSPLQVTWSVRPKVLKVNSETVGEWCKHNVFEEYYAQGVRNLVINPNLLSKIK
jgi:hypothetical protein